MKHTFLNDILVSAPFGYGNHKTLVDDNGQPVDYVFLDVNPTFEKITSLKRESIIGKRVPDVLPDIRENGFDWVAFCGEVALTGETHEFTQYAEPLGKWYKVTALSSQKGRFIGFQAFNGFGYFALKYLASR